MRIDAIDPERSELYQNPVGDIHTIARRIFCRNTDQLLGHVNDILGIDTDRLNSVCHQYPPDNECRSIGLGRRPLA